MKAKTLFLALLTLALDYFERHPSSEQCHVTSDGRVFHTAGAAESFAVALKDPKVESFTPESAAKAEESANDIDVKLDNDPGTGGTGEIKVEPIDLASFDATTEGAYITGKILLKQLNVEPENFKKETVFAAIAAEQLKLKG